MITHSFYPFGWSPPGLAAPWHFPDAGVWLLFAGSRREAIDWSRPLAGTGGDQTTLRVAAALVPGESRVFAVRAMSAAGVLEHSTHAAAVVALDENGNLPPTPLWPVFDTQATVLPTGEVRLAFSCDRQTGAARPYAFEILTDGGTGTIDTQHPLRTISAGEGEAIDVELTLSPSPPCRFAVRPVRAGRPGEMSDVTAAVSTPPALSIFRG